jgi:CRP/FNR family transcriptional regulator, anaerobic regulatory protein
VGLDRRYALTPRYSRNAYLAAANPDVAFRFMWQLVEDERRLHNQTAILGRGNAAERISTMLVDINEKRTTGMAE